jgi:hypothetical protein
VLLRHLMHSITANPAVAVHDDFRPSIDDMLMVLIN